MPSVTPIYAFPFPCPGDSVTPADFANLALAIDTKLTQLVSDDFEAKNRYNTLLTSATNILNPGVDTVVVGANSSYVLPVSGVFHVVASSRSLSFPATITSARLRVRLNAVVQYGLRMNTEDGTPKDFYTTGPIVGVAGDTITTQALYTGTGTWSMQVDLAARMLVRIA